MPDRDPERVRDTERTTIIQTDRDGGGGNGILLAVVLLLVVGVLLFFVFGGNFGRNADEGDINVNIDTPDITVPEVKMPDVQVPEVEVKPESGDTKENTDNRN